MSQTRQYDVLFLCTGNSARSVMAEALLKRWGKNKFNSYSAGSQPKGKVHPKTLETLKKNDFDTVGFDSKSWDKLTEIDSPEMDIVITVCSNAANELCPIFPGKPFSLHWDIDDPARKFSSEKDQDDEFARIFNEIEQRIKIFTNLMIENKDKNIFEDKLNEMSDPR